MKAIEKVDHSLHWAWSCQLQLRRLLDSTSAEWKLSEQDPVEKRKVFSRTSYDEHMFLVAACNLVRAVDLTVKDFPQLKPFIVHSEAIRLLRNIYEHWDEIRSDGPSRSVDDFRNKFPQAQFYSITYTDRSPVIAGILSLAEFRAQLEELLSFA
jgi:hypothetical protein